MAFNVQLCADSTRFQAMNTLWTPDGDHNVPKADEQAAKDTADDQAAKGGADETSAEAAGAAGGDAPDLTPEQEEQARAMAKELAEARARILATEASTVVANHAFGIYELAAIHLTADDPKLSEAQVAIDALGALVNGLQGRLGENETVLTDALRQAQMLFVQRSQAAAENPTDSAD